MTAIEAFCIGLTLVALMWLSYLTITRKQDHCENRRCKNKLEHPKGKNFISSKTNKEICNDCARWEQGYS